MLNDDEVTKFKTEIFLEMSNRFFSVRAQNLLINMGIKSFEELLNTPGPVLLKQRNFGRKTLNEIYNFLDMFGFDFTIYPIGPNCCPLCKKIIHPWEK